MNLNHFEQGIPGCLKTKNIQGDDVEGNDLIVGRRADCLMVLGMHRSGTSTLAGCLHLLGLNPGETLMGGNAANPSGHFENQDVVLVHDILLRDLGCRWDMVGNLPSDWLESEAAEKARQTLTGIVKRQFLGRGPWFLKDPRLCRLMPLWRRVLESLDVRPSFVLMLRHPLEAARSLEKRDGFDLLKGHLLWLVHNREALQACRDHNHIIVTFDQLMADPLGTLGRIGVALPGLQFDLARHRHEIMEFVRPELKHHHQGDESGPDEQFAPYAWLYEQFRHLQARAWTPLEGGAGSDMQRLALEEGQLAEFPLVPVASPLAPPGRIQGTAVFGDLLAVIGRYEQAERDHHLQRERQILASLRASSVLYLQVFFPGPGEPRYVEERSRKILLAPDEWQQVTVDVPRPEVLRAGRLRLDPINAQGMVSISAVNLVNPATEQVCWSARASEEFKALDVEGDGFTLASDSSFAMVSTGSDPQLLLPRLPDLPDVPLHLEVWIKVSRRQSILRDHLAALTRERDQAREQGQAQARQLEAATRERDQAREQGQAQARQLEGKEATLQALQAQQQTQREQFEQDLQKESALLAEARTELQNQKDLTLQYFKALTDFEKAQQRKERDQFQQLEQERAAQAEKIRQLTQERAAQVEKIRQLTQERDQARKQVQTQGEQLKANNNALKALETQKQNQLKQLKTENQRVHQLVHQLSNNFQALAASWRWKVGNAVVRGVEILLFRSRVQLATDHIRKLFEDYRNAFHK